MLKFVFEYSSKKGIITARVQFEMLCSQALKQQIELPREDLRSQILYLEAVKVEGII